MEQNDINMLIEELNMYVDAANYDIKMSGKQFIGWDHSKLNYARRMTEERMKYK